MKRRVAKPDRQKRPLPGQLELPVEYVGRPLRPLQFSWMCQRHLEEVTEIELFAFDDPWCEREFRGELYTPCTFGMVAEHDERVVGYAVFRLTPQRLEIINLAAAPWMPRRGIGTAIVASLMERCRQGRRGEIVACVRDSNLAAHCFFRAAGFQAVSTWRNYFAGRHGPEDAIRFLWRP